MQPQLQDPTRGGSWTFRRRLIAFIREPMSFSSLLSVGSLCEGPDSAFAGPKSLTCPPFSVVIDSTVGSFSLFDCGIFQVLNSLQVPLEGGRARTSRDW